MIVLDCSVTLSWVLPDEADDIAAALLQDVSEDGALVPSLWRMEVGNGLRIAERSRRISTAQRMRAMDMLGRLNIATDPHTGTQAWSGAYDLAMSHGLTVYDACYLELSLRSGLALATFDRALARAATGAGVVVRPG